MSEPEPSSTDEFAFPNRETIEKERNEVFEVIGKNQEEYDKQLLTLSSAFLAAAIAFIKDVVRDLKFMPVLYISLILLVVCIFLVLLSYRSSVNGHFKVLGYWDSLAEHKKAKFPYQHANRMRWFNRLTGVPFFLGVLLLVIFVILNLRIEASMANENTITHDGAFIKVPVGEVNKGAHIKQPTPVPAPTTQQSGGQQAPASGGNQQSGKQ